MNLETRTCQNCKIEFRIEPEDFAFYAKMKVPPPTFCPQCRMVRRMIWWNQRHLFRRPENLKGNEVFSWFHKDVPLTIYDRDYWWSDAWDPMIYGREYDFSRSFFEQLRELIYAVPWPSRTLINAQNSPYVSSVADVKNAYLCFAGSYLENSAYTIFFNTVKDAFDLYESRHSELCYDSYMVDEAFRVFYSVNVEECTDVWFSRNLIGCINCFGCVNLRNKSYHIFNKPYSKEAYREFMEKFLSGSYSAVEEMKKKVRAFWLRHPMRFTLAINNANVSGEHIEHSKNVHDSYSVHDSQDIHYSQFIEKSVDSYDLTRSGRGPASLIYEGSVVGIEADRVSFSAHCFLGARNLEYCLYCPSGDVDCFGCVGLQKKQYCILNRQYSKEEYFALREKIIKHMNEKPYVDKQGRVYKYGEFFPPEFSPFAYNETLASDFAPLTKEEAEKQGYLWREPEKREYETTVNAADLPDNVKDVKDNIVNDIIQCASCGDPYRIIPMELQFYKLIGLPLPRLCVECRFKERFKFINPPQFWSRKCQCAGAKDDRNIYANTAGHSHGEGHCPNEFETSYAPERPEIVYCESCYQNEVI